MDYAGARRHRRSKAERPNWASREILNMGIPNRHVAATPARRACAHVARAPSEEEKTALANTKMDTGTGKGTRTMVHDDAFHPDWRALASN